MRRPSGRYEQSAGERDEEIRGKNSVQTKASVNIRYRWSATVATVVTAAYWTI